MPQGKNNLKCTLTKVLLKDSVVNDRFTTNWVHKGMLDIVSNIWLNNETLLAKAIMEQGYIEEVLDCKSF